MGRSQGAAAALVVIRQQSILLWLFNDRELVARAVAALESRSYSAKDFSILMTEETLAEYFSGGAERQELDRIGSPELCDILADGVPLEITGLGEVVATGPLAEKLQQATGVHDKLVGVLVSSGIIEEDALHVARAIKRGGVALAVIPRNASDTETLRAEWKSHLL